MVGAAKAGPGDTTGTRAVAGMEPGGMEPGGMEPGDTEPGGTGCHGDAAPGTAWVDGPAGGTGCHGALPDWAPAPPRSGMDTLRRSRRWRR